MNERDETCWWTYRLKTVCSCTRDIELVTSGHPPGQYSVPLIPTNRAPFYDESLPTDVVLHTRQFQLVNIKEVSFRRYLASYEEIYYE